MVDGGLQRDLKVALTFKVPALLNLTADLQRGDAGRVWYMR